MYPISAQIVLLTACTLYSAVDSNDEPDRGHSSAARRASVKDTAPFMEFLQKFVPSAPSFSYNEANATKNKNDEVLDDWYGEDYYWNPFFELCPINYSADLTVGDPCENATYVSPRYDLVSALTTYLPREACREKVQTDNGNVADCPDWEQSALSVINASHNVQSFLQDQKRIAGANQTRSKFWIIGDYLGTGFAVNEACKANVNMVLDNASEFDKAASAAGVTMMALLPALLTLGNLFVPRSSEVFSTSFLVGIMSAMFSLGLPVRSISGVDSSQSPNVEGFDIKARRKLKRLGTKEKGAPNRARELASLAELRKWSCGHDGNDELYPDCNFADIRRRIQDGWKERAHRWHVPSFFIASLQLALFLLVIEPLFMAYGTPMLLFDCRNWWKSAWLLIAASLSAIFRFLMWQRGVHERVKAYSLSIKARQALSHFVQIHTAESSVQHRYTEKNLPPLNPALLEVVSSNFEHVRQKFLYMVRNQAPTSEKPVSNEPHAYKYKIMTRMRDHLRREVIVFYEHVRHPIKWCRSGFASEQPPEAARRYRPLIVLMHLSTDGRNPLKTLATGLVEGLILILLTAFFGAQWGANLFILFYMTVILLVTVTLGRMIGLLYVIYSARIWGLHVFETKDVDQIRGCLRIICSMEQVLINVNGAWFFEGHRLDQMVEWRELQRCYHAGHLDDVESEKRCDCKQDYLPKPKHMEVLNSASFESLEIGKAVPYPSSRRLSLASSRYSCTGYPAYDTPTQSFFAMNSRRYDI